MNFRSTFKSGIFTSRRCERGNSAPLPNTPCFGFSPALKSSLHIFTRINVIVQFLPRCLLFHTSTTMIHNSNKESPVIPLWFFVHHESFPVGIIQFHDQFTIMTELFSLSSFSKVTLCPIGLAYQCLAALEAFVSLPTYLLKCDI